MNQLPTLIEYLLLNHDYVVIPGFGTFIVQQMDAQRNETEEAFLPPYRSVRFNAELTQADGLLSDALRNIFKVSLKEADQMLSTWTDDLIQTLEDSGCEEFGALGIFTKEDDGSIVFTAQEAGVTTPEYYGLDAFHFSEVSSVGRARIVPITASMESDDEAITIRINRRIANFFVTACAAILLFVVFNSPLADDNALETQSHAPEWIVSHTNKAVKTEHNSVPSPTVNTRPIIKDTPSQTLENLATTAEPVESSEPAELAQPIQQPVVEEPATPEYCIVMASAISLSNAEKFVTRLKDNGFESARIINNGKMVRVVVGHYPNEHEAAVAVRDIHQRSKEFRSAWVHAL